MRTASDVDTDGHGGRSMRTDADMNSVDGSTTRREEAFRLRSLFGKSISIMYDLVV